MTNKIDIAITFWLIGQVVGRVQGHFQMDTGSTFITSSIILGLCLLVLNKKSQE